MLQGNRPRSIKDWLAYAWYAGITQYYNAKRSFKQIEKATQPNQQHNYKPTQEMPKLSIYQAYAMAKASIDINAFERGQGADMTNFKEFIYGQIGEGTFVDRIRKQRQAGKDAIYRQLEYKTVSRDMKMGNKLFQGSSNVFSASANMPTMLLDADPVGKVLKHTFAIMNPFYTDGFLNRIHNALEFDGVVAAAGQKVVSLTMGDFEEIRPTLHPNIRKDLLDEDDVRKELLKIKVNRGAKRDALDEITEDLTEDQVTKEDLDGLDTYLAKIDTITKIYSKIPAGLLPAMYYGRSALYIEKQFSDIKELDIKAGSPFSVKPINSKQLGSIIIDPATWNMLAVELNDPTVKMETIRPDSEDMVVQAQIEEAIIKSDDANNLQAYRGKTWLAAKDILYFTMNDNNTIPNSYQRGVSMLTSSIPISEERRRIYEVILPEINQTQWTGTIFWDLVGWTAEEAAELMALAETGRHIPILKAGATPHEVKFTPNIEVLYKYLDWSEEQIVQAFGLSNFAMNKEAALNKASSTNSLILINEGIVDQMRNMIKDTMNTYWYPGLIREYFGGQDQYIHIKIQVYINFITKTFESFFEKAFAISKLINEGLITLNEGRKMLKMSQLTDEEIKLLRKGNISPEDAQEMQKQGLNPFSQNNQNPSNSNNSEGSTGPSNQPGGSSPITAEPTEPNALKKLPRSS